MRASPVLRKFAVSKVVALSLAATFFSALILGCNDGENPSVPAAYRLTTTAFPAGSGTVSRSPDEPDYRAGTRVTVTAEAASGYEFAGWSGASEATTPSVSVTMNSDLTLTAIFQAISAESFVIMTDAVPAAGGSVSMNPNRTNYAAGTRVTVTAEPAEGYEFDSWSVTGGTIADVEVEVTQITVNANIIMTANFRTIVSSGTPDTRWYTSDTMALTYTLFTADELAGLAQLVNAGNSFTGRTIVLGDDVDLSSYGQQNAGFNSGRGWIPIGRYVSTSNNQPFRGEFDGNDKTVSGLYINSTGRAGLFDHVIGGTIKNLGLVSVEVVGGRFTGGLIGAAEGAIVENCYVTGAVRGGDDVGGLVGSNDGVTAAVTNSYSEASVSGASNVGGLIGVQGGGVTVANCYATGAVSGNGDRVGGLIGRHNNSATVANSYATGAVKGNTNVGGLVGGGYDGRYVSIVNSIALNSDIESTVSGVGRVLGVIQINSTSGNTISGNAAFIGMTRDQSPHEWAANVRFNGDDLTIEEILEGDGTIGNRFRVSNGWTVEPGKLPGLRGEAIDLPAHLR